MVAIFRNLQATFIILSLLYTGKRVKFDPAGKLKSVFFFFLHADNLANFELNFDKKMWYCVYIEQFLKVDVVLKVWSRTLS